MWVLNRDSSGRLFRGAHVDAIWHVPAFKYWPRNNCYGRCTIFVKLWQFDPADEDQFAIDMNLARLNSVPDVPGVSQLVLLESADELVRLEEWQPGTVRKLGEDGGAELLVLSGAITFEGEVYGKHGWIRIPPAEIREFAAGTGETRIWIKTRHLSDVTAPTV